MSMRGSLYRMVFTLIAVPFLLFSLIISQLYSQRLEKVITESLYVVANAQVAEMTNFCEQQKGSLDLIGAMDLSRAAMRGELDEEMSRYLDNMLSSQTQGENYINTLTVLAPDRRIVACSHAHNAVADAGIEVLIAGMGEETFYISDLLTDAHGNKTLAAIARVEDGGGLLGYTLAEISLDFYRDIRQRAELWNESTFYLLDGKQRIISAGTPQEDRETFVTDVAEREDYLKKCGAVDFEANPEGNFRYKVAGKEYITYYAGLAHTQWRVMLTVNLSHYQAQRTVCFLLAFFMVLLCAAVAVWIGWFASRRIIRPIKNISGTLKAIEKEQDYSLRVKVQREDELGNLAMEINGLVDFIETEDLYKTQQQRLLRQKAEQDALTKVLNKERTGEALQDALSRCRAEGAALAVLFVDVDDFKSFNTEYGHHVGDQVLLFLTALLARHTAGTVGRVGGDEFLVIVEDPVCLKELSARLEELRQAVGSQFIADGSGARLPVFCSIGAVRVDFSRPCAQTPTVERLTARADAAMYQAKNGGKRGHVIVEYEEGCATAP